MALTGSGRTAKSDNILHCPTVALLSFMSYASSRVLLWGVCAQLRERAQPQRRLAGGAAEAVCGAAGLQLRCRHITRHGTHAYSRSRQIVPRVLEAF